MIKNRCLYLVLLFSLSLNAQVWKDSLIVNKDTIQIVFTKNHTKSDLDSIQIFLKNNKSDLRYSLLEFDELGLLKKISVDILFYNNSFEMKKSEDLSLNNLKFFKDFNTVKKESFVIDEIPLFPGCRKRKNQKKVRKCLSKSIQKHIAKKFNIDLSKNLGLSPGRKKIKIFFKISKEGDIIDVASRAPHPKLEKEAIRVIKLLPKMKPGKVKGKPVNIKYTIPISFIVL